MAKKKAAKAARTKPGKKKSPKTGTRPRAANYQQQNKVVLDLTGWTLLSGNSPPRKFVITAKDKNTHAKLKLKKQPGDNPSESLDFPVTPPGCNIEFYADEPATLGRSRRPYGGGKLTITIQPSTNP